MIMEKVLGIGGVFLRSKDPKALSEWYGKHLGLPIEPEWFGAVLPGVPDGMEPVTGIWSAFPENTAYFGDPKNRVMVNFAVRDVQRMVDQLREMGCDVDEKVESNEYGTFGWVTDPEGHRVELWQPPAKQIGEGTSS